MFNFKKNTHSINEIILERMCKKWAENLLEV